MKEIVTFSIAIKIAGCWRVSPDYATAQEACSKIPVFLERFPQRYTQVTINRNVRYQADDATAKAQ